MITTIIGFIIMLLAVIPACFAGDALGRHDFAKSAGARARGMQNFKIAAMLCAMLAGSGLFVILVSFIAK